MLSQNFKIVPCGIDVDLNVTATPSADSINMKNFHKCTFLVQYVDLGTANHTVFCYSGAADGELTTAIPFWYAFGGAAQGSANCEVLTTLTACEATGLIVAHGTYDNYLMVIEVDAAAMQQGYEWLTLTFADNIGGGGATGQAIVIAVLEPRYKPFAGSALT